MAIEIQSGLAYKITNAKNTSKVLDLSGEDNRSIIGYEFHGGNNQLWMVESTEGGWIFQNVGTGQYLAIGADPNEDNDYFNGTKVVGSDNPFIWHVWEENDCHRVSVPDVRKSLDLSNHGEGPDVEIWGKWEGENQLWIFEQGL